MTDSARTSEPHVATAPARGATPPTADAEAKRSNAIDNQTIVQQVRSGGSAAGFASPPADNQVALARLRVQRKAAGTADPVRSTAALAGLSGGGEPLDPATGARFGARFGEDFGGVRIHAGASAAAAATALAANAFTVGEDVSFAQGHYQPGTPAGDRLIAHELTHVVQQRRAPSGPQAQSRISDGADPSEREADDVAARAVDGEHVAVTQVPGAAIARDGNDKDAHPPGTVAERAEAVKATIRASAKHRLQRNREALAAWATYLSAKLTPFQVQAQATAQNAIELYRSVSHAQSNGGGARQAEWFEEWAKAKGRNMRSVKARLVKGEIHDGCEQCHEENWARGADFLDQESGLPQLSTADFMTQYGWTPRAKSPFGDKGSSSSMSPLNQVGALGNASASDPGVADGTGSLPSISDKDRASYFGVGKVDPAQFPETERVMQAVAAIRPYLDLLGSSGYNVLTHDPVGVTPGDALADITGMIEERRADFAKLSTAIENGDVEWWELTPIVNDVLPMADAEAKAALQDEMAVHQRNAKIKAYVMLGISIALLLVAILLPPTAPVFAGVSVSMFTSSASLLMSAYQLGQGVSDLSHSQTLLQGAGASDVLNATDIEGARQIAAFGLTNVIFGSVGLGASGSALASSVKTGALITRGPWTVRLSITGREFMGMHESGLYYVTGTANQGAAGYAFIDGKWEHVFTFPGGAAAEATATAGATTNAGDSLFPLVLAQPKTPMFSMVAPETGGSSMVLPEGMSFLKPPTSPFLLGAAPTTIGGLLSNESLAIIEARYGAAIRAQVATSGTQTELDAIGKTLGGRRNVFLADVSELASADVRMYQGQLVVRARGTGTTPGMDLLTVNPTGVPTLTIPEVKMGASASPYQVGASGLPNAFRDKATFYKEIVAVLKDPTIPIETRVRIQLAVNENRIQWELDAFGNVRVTASGTDAFPGSVTVKRPINVPK